MKHTRKKQKKKQKRNKKLTTLHRENCENIERI